MSTVLFLRLWLFFLVVVKDGNQDLEQVSSGHVAGLEQLDESGDVLRSDHLVGQRFCVLRIHGSLELLVNELF